MKKDEKQGLLKHRKILFFSAGGKVGQSQSQNTTKENQASIGMPDFSFDKSII